MYTSRSRFTGMSGIDVESIVSGIMGKEGMKHTRLKQQRDKTVWKQQAFQEVGAKMKTFQQTYLDFLTATTPMRTKEPYNAFSIAVKQNGVETAAISASATSSSEEGTYKFSVSQIAISDTYSGAHGAVADITSSGITTGYFKEGDSFNISIDSGINKKIEFSQEDVAILNSGDKTQIATLLNQKLTDVYSSTNGAKIVAKVEGDVLKLVPDAGHSVKLSSNNTRPSFVGTIDFRNAESAQFSALGDGFTIETEDGLINVDVSTNVNSASELISNINDALKEKDLSNRVYAQLDMSNGQYKVRLVYNSDEKIIFSTEGGSLLKDVGIDDDGDFQMSNALSDLGFKSNGSSKLDIKKSLNEIFGITGDGNFIVNGKSIAYSEIDSVQAFINKVNTSGANVKLKYDSFENMFKLEAINTGIENKIVLGADVQGNTMANTLGLLIHQEGQDAIFKLNNKEYSRPTNSFEIYGINITINDVTDENQPITIQTDRNAEKAVENIEKFVADYNKLIEDLSNEYKASRNRKEGYSYYDPLTDEQKEEMSEKDIEKWEIEGKKGLLSKDPTIGEVLSTLRSMMYESVTLENGKNISLYEIGITTSSTYTDGGKLVIDKNKLKKSLSERADEISQLFTRTSSYKATDIANYNNRLKDEGITERINDILNKTISPSNGKLTIKAGIKDATVKNDIGTELSTMDKNLDKMWQQLIKKEDILYKKFSVMEEAVQKSNTQMASLTGWSGQGA